MVAALFFSALYFTTRAGLTGMLKDDASHELRAPVAVTLAHAESLRANAFLPSAGFRTRRPDCARSRAIGFRSCRKFAAADTNMK